VGLLACGAASAQYASDFEAPTFSGSAEGFIMTGQDGFYIPAGTESTDYLVYTYADNAIGVVDNPGGGAQFVAGIGPAGDVYARAQRDIDWGTGTVVVTYDVACLWLADPNDPNALADNNIGSFSNQPTTGSVGSQIHLFSWVVGEEGVLWNAFYMHNDAAGTQVAQPGSSPGPEWENLELNHWYRFSTTMDFDANLITEVSVTDLSTGASATFAPTEWYLSGGSAGGPPTITAFRFFAGGLEPDNTVAWDNLSIAPPGNECEGDIDGDGDTDLSDLAALLASYNKCDGDPGYEPAADYDGSGCVDLSDLAFLLADYLCGT
jgi:hypothetical protein